jgi:peptide/nickel transport system substrate-binding protein
LRSTRWGLLRPNWLYPPFNNKKARQALLYMMDQVTYLEWAIGQSEYYRPCYSVFACGGPYATTISAEPMMQWSALMPRLTRSGVG